MGGDDFRRTDGMGDQVHGDGTGVLGGPQPVGVHGGDGGGIERHHPQRAGNAGHGAGGAHDAAGAGGGREAPLDGGDAVGGNGAGAVLRPVAAAIGAGREALALEGGGEHGAGDKLQARDVGRGGGHELGRDRLVAAANQHRGVHGL